MSKAEKVLDASRIQNSNTESQSFGVASVSKRLDKEDPNSTASFLFPHLVQKNKNSGPELDKETPFSIHEFVSPRKKEVDPEIEFTNAGQNASPKSDDDLFADLDADIFRSPVKSDCIQDLRIPLRRLFDDDNERSSPKKKLRNRKDPAPPNRTPRKSQAVSKTPIKTSPSSHDANAPADKTPIKNNSSAVALTPIKTPAQKRGDQDFNEDVRTPIKTAAQKRGDQDFNEDVRTPIKTSAQKRGDQDFNEDVRTPIKTAAQKRGDQNVSFEDISRTPVKATEKKNLEISYFEKDKILHGEPSLKTPMKATSAQTIENVSPLKLRSSTKVPSKDRISESGNVDETKRTTSGRRSRREKSISDASNSGKTLGHQTPIKKSPQKHQPQPEATKQVAKEEASTEEATTTLICGRPARRKSTSFRLGIDDIPLNEAIFWSPSGKSGKASRLNFDTPPKTYTPKTSRLASPASAQPTPCSKSKLRRTPKVNLFAPENVVSEAETETPEVTTVTSRRMSKRYNTQNDNASKADENETSKTASKSGKLEEETDESASTRAPTIISFSKSSISAAREDPFDGDTLSKKIVEMSSANKRLTSSEPITVDRVVRQANPSVSLNKSSPKHRTPKRLRSGANKRSPNSKRRKVSVEFFSDPPVISDSPAIESEKQKISESHSNEDLEKHSAFVSISKIKSPEKSWSVSSYESPRGEFKLRIINRKKKPELSPFMPVNRISRRMTHDTGLAPEILNQLMCQSPSPKKKLSMLEKENVTTRDSTNVASPRHVDKFLRRLDTNTNQSLEQKPKFSPLTSRGLAALTTSPIVDKKDPSGRSKNLRVHKRLYNDDDSEDFV